ncbi:unnamed protein product [Eruca vesicaria subsp. sativa]|uniref:F-box domain-containing protein n=1 Tax=Eruca vesicaria subsp. sativa TaxID=29727 RepID=A0ABC8L4V7_ERUVS|nr:unnamed protein product [Eruca vesicaria subsp. sativa]
MAEEGRSGDGATDDSHRKRDGVDLISLLPDEILQTILSSLETFIAVRTSILSKRWRHVWSGTPSLYLNLYTHGPEGDSINNFIERYTVRKMMSFELWAHLRDKRPYVDRWIEFAMSRNVENMTLFVFNDGDQKYQIPDFFYINNSIRKISVNGLYSGLTIPSYVSWTSLKMLALRNFSLYDECIDKIISGCPVLESLSLSFCLELMVLDLSKSLSLRTLEIYRQTWFQGPKQIVAPHIRCLRLKDSQLPCTLVDVSSLNEARLDICFYGPENPKDDFLQVMGLEKLQNVEKLTFRENFLKILSLAELRCVPFPSFKVKNLTLVTMISQYVIPGIVRVLQNSPELKKLTIIHTSELYIPYSPLSEKHIDTYLDLQSLSVEARVFENIRDWDIESKHVASFMELMFKNTKTLEKMVVWLKSYDHGRISAELFEMIPVLSEKNNVTIVLNSSASKPRD